MKKVKTFLKGLEIIRTKIFRDNRGFFKEVYYQKTSKENNFIFDCMSFSKKNTLRGLHLQKEKSQAKLLTVTEGKIFDVCVDLRKNSSTYGKYFQTYISQDSDFSILIPPGFAHGFLCVSKKCVVYYKCSNYRDKKSEITLKWNDPDLNIKWPCTKPILSPKDKKGFFFKEL